jgi:hypothetical protein
MIGPPTNTRVWIATGVTDLRRGFTGLSALVQTTYSGANHLLKMNLLKIRGDDLLPKFVGFRRHERDTQSCENSDG